MAKDNIIRSPERLLTRRSTSARSDSSTAQSTYTERPVQKPNRRSKTARDKSTNRRGNNYDSGDEDDEQSEEPSK